jgi:Family of unknown function (DUF6459)
VATSAALRLAPPPVLREVAASTSDPRPTTVWLAQAIAEVLAGARPASQLAETATPEVIALLARNTGRLRARHDVAPQRPIVDAVHLGEPRPGVAEACAVVDLGLRCRAIAFRLEQTSCRWRCTAVRIG